MSKRYPEFSKYFDSEALLLAYGLIFSLLGIVQGLRWRFQVYQGGNWVESGLYFGSSLVFVLVVLVVALSYLVFRESSRSVLVFPVVYLVLFRGLDLSLNLSVVCVFLVFVKMFSSWSFEKVFFCVLFFGSLFLGLVLFHWVVLLPFGIDVLSALAAVEHGVYHFIGSISPYVYLVFIIVCIFGFREKNVHSIHNKTWNKSKRNLFLFFLGVATMYLTIYQYHPAINPHQIDVGTDYQVTLDSLQLVESNPINAFKVIDGQRPFYFLSLTLFGRLIGLTNDQTIRFFPIFLNLLLLYSAYVFSSQVFNDQETGILSCFFMVFGYPVITGISSGVQSNILGLSFALLSIGYVFKIVKEENRLNFVISIILAGLVLFTHPWTFYQYYGSLIVMVIFHWIRQYRNERGFEPIIPQWYLVSLGLFYIVKQVLSLFISGGELIPISSRLTTLSSFWPDVVYGSLYIFGGILSNILFLILTLVYYSKRVKSDLPETYLRFFMFSTALIWIIGDEALKSRLILNSPIWLFSASGLIYLLDNIESRLTRDSLLLFIILSTCVYSFRSVAYLF